MCDIEHRVVELNLAGHGLNGQIPTQLGLLSFLTNGGGLHDWWDDDGTDDYYLLGFLSSNSLTGTLPSEIGQLPELSIGL